MSLYYEATDILKSPTNAGGSFKSRIFSNKTFKSQPSQLYALVIETCKWSPVLKEIIERSELLSLERKLSPILSLLLVHDLLLAKKGIALPATHGLRQSIERHKARLQAEFTKARIRRGIGSFEVFKDHVDGGAEDVSTRLNPPHPRWIRINTLKTSIDDQLDTTFAGYEMVRNVESVRGRGPPRIYIDGHIPNLIAIPQSIDLTKSEAYTSGAIIFQDKASCFPAYMLDPLPQDGQIMDACAAPGNKTTHLAAILSSRNRDADNLSQLVHACEKDRSRAETLKKMVTLAGSDNFTKIHAGQDFLKLNPDSAEFKDVGALLLDPSCSGSGIVGRDDMPLLHLPVANAVKPANQKSKEKSKAKEVETEPRADGLKRKHQTEETLEVIVDDDGNTTTVITEQDFQARLAALSTFQLSLLLHAFRFPAATKITYSTCSIHAEENELVVQKALSSDVGKERGWRILKRTDQMRGLREWSVRGNVQYCDSAEIADACIRANKGDENGTMGFFVAGFVRDIKPDVDAISATVVRDERGFIVRDLLGFPVRAGVGTSINVALQDSNDAQEEEEEWAGFGDDAESENKSTEPLPVAGMVASVAKDKSSKKRRKALVK